MNKLFIAILLVLLFTGCKKEEQSDLTDVSPNGEYFNCYINGKYWTFKQCTFCSGDALRSYQVYRNVPDTITGNRIEGSSSDFPQTVIEFVIAQEDFLAGDTIMLGRNSFRSLTDSGLSFAQIEHVYNIDNNSVSGGATDSIHTGRLVFTKRTGKWQEGTFYFNASNGLDVISITNGRFAIAID